MAINNLEKPVLMLEKEVVWGKSFEDKVVDLYATAGNYERLANALQISRQTLYVWLRLVGIRHRDLKLAVIERHRERA